MQRMTDTAPEVATEVATEPHALVELDGHKLVVTMNRPEARNALSGEMLAILEKAWERADGDPEVRAVILTGAGGYFCAGADLKSMNKRPPSESFESGSYDPTVIKSLLKGYRLTKPLIAAVEGPAIAGGTEILTATDIRIAGESAKFGISEARWSLYPLGGSVVRLPRQIPQTVAMDLLLTGRHITAAEAKELGLIGHVVPDGQALAKAHEIADMICANGPLAVQAILKTVRDSEGRHENDCWADDAKVGAAVFKSNDAKEGPRAFAEKRKPDFTGS
jgi:enoyl-CoA hydratase